MTEQITYRTGTYGTETEPMHIWEIADEDGTAAALYVRQADLVIANIETRQDRRREGLAAALYEAAADQMDILHDLPHHCSPEGLAFAEAMGGDTIDTADVDCDCFACTYDEAA